MHVNWLTVAIVVIILWSVGYGAVRGFALETGHLVAELISLAVSAVAIWAAWVGSSRLSAYAAHVKTTHWPQFAVQVLQWWQQAPGIARAIAFVIVYLLVSGLLHRLLYGFTALLPRAIPGPIGRSRLLGAGLGAVAGVAHALIFGGLVFLLLQYVSVPAIAAMAKQSPPYQVMRTRAFEPVLRPLLTSELPVYARGALAPLTKNINLFVVPTGVGKERGILVVPKQIATLAKQIAGNQPTAKAKAYALYEWEIHHIRYDWQKYYAYVKYGKWEQQSPLQTLETGTGVCADYALLYADLAHSVGLTVQIDEGLGGTPGQYGSHAWNKVYLPSSGQWIPVDTTWGSQQDAWFDPQHFSNTHIQQTQITIDAGQGAAS
ncbi:transglutaminase domain-containing protein [Alicyclobacillus sp. ALC3]|uniref:transglutaminase domain-containing protein n=1 Tax=Alicyclobacillus sp. ALC3 TaxID=2796143 RepID=UPI00237893E7|nr:transglutaminase domain-containing protein [Alicyclobacillus sp. ALC3]WDL96319.1 transglutaminase domain-containing protein [Alicyclobacillus sp. ALC3]